MVNCRGADVECDEPSKRRSTSDARAPRGFDSDEPTPAPLGCDDGAAVGRVIPIFDGAAQMAAGARAKLDLRSQFLHWPAAARTTEARAIEPAAAAAGSRRPPRETAAATAQLRARHSIRSGFENSEASSRSSLPPPSPLPLGASPAGQRGGPGAPTILGKRSEQHVPRRSPPKRFMVPAAAPSEFDSELLPATDWSSVRDAIERAEAEEARRDQAPSRRALSETTAAVAADLLPSAAAFVSEKFGGEAPIGRLADSRARTAHRISRIREYERKHYASYLRKPNLPSAVKLWIEFVVGEARSHPLRPECTSLPDDEQEDEFELLRQYADFLFHDKGLRANTVENYLSIVRGWHIENCGWAPGLNPNRPNQRLTRMITGFYRERPKRAPERHAHTAALFANFRAPIQPAIDSVTITEFNPDRPDSISPELRRSVELFRLQLSLQGQWDRFMTCAALELQLCCLSRPGELYPTDVRFTANDFRPEFEGGVLHKGIAMVLPEKKAARSLAFNQKILVPLLVEQGPNLQALRLCTILLLLNAIDKRTPDVTPFFTYPNGGPRAGKPLSTRIVKVVYNYLLREAGVTCPELYDYCHVPRIIGATALAAENYSPAILKGMGRWGSDIAFIYARASRAILERAQRALGRSDAGSLAAELIEAAARFDDGQPGDEAADDADDDAADVAV